MTTQYNIVSYGTLTNTNGVLSNFSASNYATIPLTFNPVQHPYEMVFKVNTETMPTNANGIIWQTGDYLAARGRLDLEVGEDKLYTEFAANGELVWNIAGVTTLSSNTDYYVKLTYNGINTYGLYLSTDGTTWTTEGTTTSSGFLGDGTAEYNIIGVQPDEGGMIAPWFGSIDLNESYININGIRWWQGVTSISNVQTRIQLRHDTAANWTSVNPILLEGEVGIETDTLKQKVGDGVTAWNSLAYSVDMSSKQDTLVSGTNIKTVNNTSLLGSGNIDTSEIFIAEHSVTTYADTLNAYNAGKTILLTIGNGDYHGILYTYTGEEFRFVVFSESGSNKEIIFFKLNQYSGWNNGTSKTIVNDNLSNVTTISSNSAVQTALNAKVNKSGDTMTGELNITNASGLTIINDAVTKGTTPSSTIWRHLQFVDSANISGDWGVSRLGILEQSINDNGSTSMLLSTVQNTVNSTNRATLTLTMTSAGVGSCTFPNTTCVDGQWIASYQEAIGSTAQTISGQTTKDITFSNLPAKNCEVIFSVSQSTDYELGIYSSIISGGTVNRAMKKGCATFIMPVSSDKKVKIYNINSNTASINFVRMFGYRVLGTNATP